jgi:hypothetical protein
MEHEVLNSFFLAEPLNLPIGMSQFLPFLIQHQPLDAHNALLDTQTVKLPTQGSA